MYRLMAAVVVAATVLGVGCGDPEPRRREAGDGTQASGGDATRPAEQTAAATQAAATQAAGTATAPAGAPERLFGTWIARNVQASIGQVDIHLTFREEGPVRILAWSDIPFVGQVRNKSGPYEVDGQTISSEAIRGGTSVKYRFSPEGHLIIEYQDGKTVVFQRQAGGGSG